MAVSLKIKNITAREILNSRGIPTLEVILTTKSGITVSAGVPAGASTGKREALDLRDNDMKRYRGKGVLKALNNVNHKIAPKLTTKTFKDLQAFDDALIALDKSSQKTKLGGNAMVGVSIAAAKAFAAESSMTIYQYIAKAYGFTVGSELPIPMMNIFNGGKHADTNLDIQELIVVPMRKKLMTERVRMGAEIFSALREVLKDSGYDTDVGDEGGFAPDIYATTEALRMIMIAIRNSGYVPGKDVGLAFDVGANTMYDEKKKQYRFKLDANFFSPHQLIALYEVWEEQFPIISIEDGLSEDDWDNWALMTQKLGKDMMIVGDDLFTSNVAMLEKGIKIGAANAILIKPNQIGTISETVQTVKLAKKHDMKVVVSHRSGETNDDFIADFAVGVGADFVKFGAPNRGERVAKYNRLLAIEDDLMHS